MSLVKNFSIVRILPINFYSRNRYSLSFLFIHLQYTEEEHVFINLFYSVTSDNCLRGPCHFLMLKIVHCWTNIITCVLMEISVHIDNDAYGVLVCISLCYYLLILVDKYLDSWLIFCLVTFSLMLSFAYEFSNFCIISLLLAK